MTDRDNELMMDGIRKYKADLLRQRAALKAELDELDELSEQDDLRAEIETLNQQVLQERARKGLGLTINAVILAVCREFEITTVEIKSRRNSWRLSTPRHAAFSLLYELTGRSLPAIGRAMGFHHTSVMHGIAKTTERMKDPKFAARIERIKASLVQPKTDLTEHHKATGRAEEA